MTQPKSDRTFPTSIGKHRLFMLESGQTPEQAK